MYLRDGIYIKLNSFPIFCSLLWYIFSIRKYSFEQIIPIFMFPVDEQFKHFQTIEDHIVLVSAVYHAMTYPHTESRKPAWAL